MTTGNSINDLFESIMKSEGQRTVTVSIGRNVGTEPMSDDDWYGFRSALTDIVSARATAVHFQGEGTGYFEGNIEASFTLVASIGNVVGLYHVLAELAHEYGQESIALTTGNTSFPGTREA